MQSAEELKIRQVIYSIQNKMHAINTSADHMHATKHVSAMRKINLPYIKDKLDDLSKDISMGFSDLVLSGKFSKQEIFDNFIGKLFTNEEHLPNLSELMQNLNEIYLNKFVLYYNETVRAIPLEARNNIEAAFLIEEQFKNSEHFFILINDLYKTVKFITKEISKDADLIISDTIKNQFTKFYNEYEDTLQEHVNFSSFLKSKKEELHANKTSFTKVNYKYVRKSQVEFNLALNKKTKTKVQKKVQFQNSEIVIYPVEDQQAVLNPCRAALKAHDEERESNLAIDENITNFAEFTHKSKITNSTMNYIRRSLSAVIERVQSAKFREDMTFVPDVIVNDIHPFITTSGLSRVFYAEKDNQEFILANPDKVLYKLSNIRKVMHTALKTINYAVTRAKRLEADSVVKELEDFKFTLGKELSNLNGFIPNIIKLLEDNKVTYSASNTDNKDIIIDFQEVVIEEKLPITSVSPAKTLYKNLHCTRQKL